MIDSITGDVVRKGPDFVVLDTGGIAFQAFCPADTLGACVPGHESLLYIHLILREDTLQLYGFSNLRERAIFRQLLTVGQVGPRLAIQILSTLPPAILTETIAQRDIARLTSVKGVGRKTAERILVDLRDKITASDGRGAEGFLLTDVEETALRALTSKSLGFSAREAREVLGQLRGQDLSAEMLVRRALKILGSSS